MRTKKFISIILLFFICSMNILAQKRDFSEWDATAFCFTTMYTLVSYVEADNNWEIIQTLQVPRTRQSQSSLSINSYER